MASSSSSIAASSSSVLCTEILEEGNSLAPDSVQVLRLRATNVDTKEETRRQTSK